MGARVTALATSPLPTVSVGSDEEGGAVLDRIRIWLPVLAALSANPPFWNGADTGYASYRTQARGRWPAAGPVELFDSAARSMP